eukprot:1155788-Pelagomonas_calceolata.AAC.3
MRGHLTFLVGTAVHVQQPEKQLTAKCRHEPAAPPDPGAHPSLLPGTAQKPLPGAAFGAEQQGRNEQQEDDRCT